THTWCAADLRGCEIAVEIQRCERFSLMGEGVGGLLDDEFRRHWLTPFHQRLVEKGRQALAQMRQYEAQVVKTYRTKDVVIYYQEPGASAATLLLNDDVNAIKATVSESLRVIDPGVVLSVRC